MITIRLLDNFSNLNSALYEKKNKFIIFDIDNTLYKENKELVFHRRMAGYKKLNRDLNISISEYYKLSSEYTKKYGTNYKGFIKNFKISEDLIKEINNICGDIKPFFTEMSRSVKLLQDISLIEDKNDNKVGIFCFSNSNQKQSEYVLDVLGLSMYIDILFCVSYKKDVETICKPMIESFDKINNVLNKEGNKKILFFDDNEKNIEGGHRAGWISIKVENADEIESLVKNAIQIHFN